MVHIKVKILVLTKCSYKFLQLTYVPGMAQVFKIQMYKLVVVQAESKLMLNAW